MSNPLRILIAEDTPLEAELTLRNRRSASFVLDCRRVETEQDLLA